MANECFRLITNLCFVLLESRGSTQIGGKDLIDEIALGSVELWRHIGDHIEMITLVSCVLIDLKVIALLPP